GLGGSVPAWTRPLDRLRLDHAVAADREEALRRDTEHRDVRELEERSVGDRADPSELEVGLARVDRGSRRDGVRQADLVGLALVDLLEAASDPGEVGPLVVAELEHLLGA